MNKFFKGVSVGCFFVSLFSASSVKALIDLSTIAAVIDVRTSAETGSGHLQGALLFDVRGKKFKTQIAALDKSANYIVYCQSGTRAAKAIFYMKQAGFTGTITNAGSMANAALLTGLTTVRAKEVSARRVAKILGSAAVITSNCR